MTHSYDSYGWLSLTNIPARQTEVEPPAHNPECVAGQPWPNWTGIEWVTLIYSPPVPVSPPPQPRPLSILAFRSRFTDGEKIAIYTAAESSLGVRVWLDDLAAAQGQMVDLNDERIVAGVNAMEFGGLIGAGRAEQILL